MGERALEGKAMHSPVAGSAQSFGASCGVVQARWLIDPTAKIFFWEEEASKEPIPSPPTILLEKGLKLAEAPKTPYSVDKGSRRDRLVYSFETYLKSIGGGTSRAKADVYNPFGRFATAISSFIPSNEFSQEEKEALDKSFQEKDKNYQKPKGIPTGAKFSSLGYPSQITVEGGQVLAFVEENEFGAVYALNPPASNLAKFDKSLAQDPGQLKLTPPPSSDVKLGNNWQIDPQAIEGWSGKKRSIDQGQVMGASAADVAENAGFDRDEGLGWEWLHMIAHSMGGIAVQGPQVEGNLVAGTSECNSQMIVVEEFLKDLVTRNKGKAALFVGVRMFDPLRHIGEQITYDFEMHNASNEPVAVYHWSFNALSRRQPMVMENRGARYAARSRHEGGGTAATTHIPRSAPTTHGPLADPSKDPVDAVGMAFDTLPADGFIAKLLELRVAQGGSLSIDAFILIGDKLKPGNVMTYLELLAKQYPNFKAVGMTLHSFVQNQRDQALLKKLWKEVASLYERHGQPIPDYIKKTFESFAPKSTEG